MEIIFLEKPSRGPTIAFRMFVFFAVFMLMCAVWFAFTVWIKGEYDPKFGPSVSFQMLEAMLIPAGLGALFVTAAFGVLRSPISHMILVGAITAAFGLVWWELRPPYVDADRILGLSTPFDLIFSGVFMGAFVSAVVSAVYRRIRRL